MNERGLDRPKRKAVSASGELLPVLTPDRVVVFGTVLTGVYKLRSALEGYLKQKGINSRVEAYRNMEYIIEDFYSTLLEGERPILPRGVIALPEMRDYSLGAGATEPTPFDVIQDLCEKHGVPFVKFDKAPTLEQLRKGATLFLPEHLE